MAPLLFHIIGGPQWRSVKDLESYVPQSFSEDGFIHLSKKEQILRPANLLYAGQRDLVLLVINAERLDAKLVMEPGSHGESELFPHLYGPLNLAAVERVVEFPCDDEGLFTLPDGLG